MSSPGPPPPNPILTAYEGFVRDTPLVTRYTLTTLFCSWFGSFFFDASFALNTVPYFTIYKFEIYRVALSPLVCQSALSLVFAYLSFIDNGKRLEHSLGSTGFAWFMLTIGCVTNLLFCVACLVLSFLTNEQGYLWWQSTGIWTVVFGIIANECSKAPANDQRRLFVVNVPTLYYPIALWVLFALIGGGTAVFGYFISIGVGYAYGYGYLDRLKVHPTRFNQWEESILANFTQREGWVVGHAATGDAAWDNMGTNSGMSVTPSAAAAAAAPGRVAPPVAPTPAFAGTGRSLGSTRATKDTRSAMREAAERRAQETNENIV